MSEGMSESDVHEILRNERRQRAIEHLRENDGTANVRELSEAIAERESGESPPPRDLRQSVYVSLHQTHLPKLDTFGIVSYDINAKTVRLQDEVETLEAYMEPNDSNDDVDRYYALIAAGGLCGAGVSALLVSGGSFAVSLTVAMLGLLAILGLSLSRIDWADDD